MCCRPREVMTAQSNDYGLGTDPNLNTVTLAHDYAALANTTVTCQSFAIVIFVLLRVPPPIILKRCSPFS